MTEQAARCVLKLNTPVLNTLFPEGTEARVQLQQAVLAEVSRSYVKESLTQEIKAHLHTLTQEVKSATDVKGVIRQYFETSPGWNSVTKLKPDTALTAAIASAVEKALSDQFYTQLEERVAKGVAEYTEKLDARVDFAVKQRIEQLTVKAINERVTAAVDAARAAL